MTTSKIQFQQFVGELDNDLLIAFTSYGTVDHTEKELVEQYSAYGIKTLQQALKSLEKLGKVKGKTVWTFIEISD